MQLLRSSLDHNGLDHVRIVAVDDYEAEFETNLARDMLVDPTLSASVDVVG